MVHEVDSGHSGFCQACANRRFECEDKKCGVCNNAEQNKMLITIFFTSLSLFTFFAAMFYCNVLYTLCVIHSQCMPISDSCLCRFFITRSFKYTSFSVHVVSSDKLTTVSIARRFHIFRVTHRFLYTFIPPLFSYASRTLRPQDTSAPQNWCRSFKTNYRWSCLIGIVMGRSVPAFRQSRHSCRSVSYHVFRCRSALRSVPKCPRVS